MRAEWLHCIHMIAQLIKVGNSKGIRIPKPLIEECRLTEKVNLEVQGESLVISPIREVREGWAGAFKGMSEQGDDQLLNSESLTDWDEKEWEWK